MTNDEMLKLAAKAAGLILLEHEFFPGVLWLPHPDEPTALGQKWNPLKDDGDALRLAVTLRMYLMHLGIADVGARCPQSAPMVEDYNGDPCAATRRAIVRAAAEFGSRSNAVLSRRRAADWMERRACSAVGLNT